MNSPLPAEGAAPAGTGSSASEVDMAPVDSYAIINPVTITYRLLDVPVAQKGGISSCVVPLAEGFEANQMPPAGWSLTQNNYYTWQVITDTFHSGSHAAYITWDDNLDLQNEILFSPAFTTNYGRLEFYSAGSTYWCRDDYDNCDVNVWMVIGAWGGGDDVLLGKADNSWLGDYIWSKSTFDLTAYTPITQPVRIAFQYYGIDGNDVALDDIKILGGCDNGFDSQFAHTAPGWVSHSGSWNFDDNYLFTPGLMSTTVSASYVATYTNYIYQAQMWRYGCPTCANRLFVRGVPDPLDTGYYWYSEYLFQYSADGRYSVFKKAAGGAFVTLKDWTYSPLIHTGDAWNELTVTASSDKLAFYINNSLVWSGTDTSLASGRVGLGMYNDGSAGNLLYVNYAWLRELP